MATIAACARAATGSHRSSGSIRRPPCARAAAAASVTATRSRTLIPGSVPTRSAWATAPTANAAASERKAIVRSIRCLRSVRFTRHARARPVRAGNETAGRPRLCREGTAAAGSSVVGHAAVGVAQHVHLRRKLAMRTHSSVPGAPSRRVATLVLLGGVVAACGASAGAALAPQRRAADGAPAGWPTARDQAGQPARARTASRRVPGRSKDHPDRIAPARGRRRPRRCRPRVARRSRRWADTSGRPSSTATARTSSPRSATGSRLTGGRTRWTRCAPSARRSASRPIPPT